MNLKISFVVVAKNKSIAQKQMERLEKLKSQFEEIGEIILVCGTNPSKQRNIGIEKATGQWIYFLDDDSILSSMSFKNMLDFITVNREAKILGGPSILQKNASEWERAIEVVFKSFVGIGPLTPRYNREGKQRLAFEGELILCNMLVRKDLFHDHGGFSEKLYPNEENELLNRLETEKIYYIPEGFVERPHRKSPREFFKQVLHYGMGRSKMFKMTKSPSNLKFYIPLLLTIITISMIPTGNHQIAIKLISGYALLILINTVLQFIKNKKPFWPSIVFKTVFAFVICHTAYVLGLFIGLFKPID